MPNAPSPNEPRRKRVAKLAAWLISGAALGAASLVAATQDDPMRSSPQSLLVVGRTLSYSEAFAAQAGIHTVEVREAAFSPVLFASGRADFEPEQVILVDANALGTVRRVAKYEGDRVKRGEVLAELGSRTQAVREAARLPFGREGYTRALGVSLLRSPLDGTVIERRIVTGQSVRGESVAFVVANLERLSVNVDVEDSRASGLVVGDRVELLRDALLGAIGSGTVAEVERRASPESEPRLRIRVRIDNRAGRVRVGEGVTVRIFVSHPGRALVVPNRALTWIGGHPTVFVAASAHSAIVEPVTLGGGDGERTEVLGGLTLGQRVVTDGVPVLKDAAYL